MPAFQGGGALAAGTAGRGRTLLTGDGGTACPGGSWLNVSAADPGQYRGMSRCAFDRPWGQEDERLEAVERQLDPISQAAAGQLGLAAGPGSSDSRAGRLWTSAIGRLGSGPRMPR